MRNACRCDLIFLPDPDTVYCPLVIPALVVMVVVMVRVKTGITSSSPPLLSHPSFSSSLLPFSSPSSPVSPSFPFFFLFYRCLPYPRPTNCSCLRPRPHRSRSLRCSLRSDRYNVSLQEDLRKMLEWSVRWEMPFNVNKCRILQIGTRNQNSEYEMNGVKLKSVHCVKNFGVTIASSFKFSSNAKMPQVKL